VIRLLDPLGPNHAPGRSDCIAVSTIIDAGTASSSPFQQTSKIVHDYTGIVFTFRWNLRS
jgi:hypothetical protein